jgi:hypothetical protein
MNNLKSRLKRVALYICTEAGLNSKKAVNLALEKITLAYYKASPEQKTTMQKEWDEQGFI